MKNIIKKVENNITVVIPSRSLDSNLINCIKKIRKFYRKIKIILVLDFPIKNKLDKNIKILISGNKTIGYKRNLGVKFVNTKLISLIDSDAYPSSFWLNESIDILRDTNIAAIGGPNISPKSYNIEKILVANSRINSIVTLNPIVKSRKTKKHYINFLPSCNFIIKTSIYKKVNGMDSRLYSSEEISLNLKVRKLGYKMIFNPKIFVYHIERNFKHFFRQRFIYGSTGLWCSIRYPCKESFLLLASSFPLLYCLCFPLIFINKDLRLFFLTGIMALLSVILLNAYKINFKNNFLKSLKLSFISFFVPGLGLVARIFLKDKIFKGLYTQK